MVVFIIIEEVIKFIEDIICFCIFVGEFDDV